MPAVPGCHALNSRRDRGAARGARSRACLGAALALALAATAGLPALHVAAARADEVTASQDNLRTGWDPNEPGLAPTTGGGPVGGPAFGQLFKTHLNGQVFGQPVIAGSVLIAVTETNHVYGLNAATGAVEWSDYLGPAEPASATGCADVSPAVGITSTPVYDPTTGAVYLVAVVDDGPTENQPHVYAYALNAQTGTTMSGWPVAIKGSAVNDPAAAFNTFTERQRAALLLLNGSVYVAFASYCDFQPYAGYVAGISTTSRALTLWSDEAGLTDSQAGIWQSNGGLMSDGPGRIFLATGNGVSPAAGPGASPPAELAESVVRLNVAGTGAMSAADFFSPANAPTLDATDRDFGSGGPVGLPFGTSADPDLLVQAGKDGRVFLLNRDGLGGRAQGTGGTDDAVSESGPYARQFGHPAVFGPDATVSAAVSGDYVYFSGAGDVLRYLQFGADPSGTPVLTDVANTTTAFPYTSGSPVVTSNGNDPASAVVWAVASPGGSGVGASLQAFDAIPGSSCTAATQCAMSPIWSAPIGTASRFTFPATDSGRVYVGTRDGNILCFGSPYAAPLTGSPVNFGRVRIGGQPRTETATMTAAGAVTVTGITMAAAPGKDPFSVGSARVGGSPVTFPATLSQGEKLTVPVTFAPAQAGGVTAAVQIGTTAANFPTISLSVTGQGTIAGLQAAPAAVAFGTVPDRTTATSTVLVTNWSTVAEKVTGTRGPGRPFSARLPATGRVLTPGQSAAVQVSYHPLASRLDASSLVITTSGGHNLTVRLTGTGERAVSRLTASQALVRFGNVQLGTRATRTVVITNTGNLPAVISTLTGPAAPFGKQVSLSSGLPLSPRYKISVPVTLTPASTGAVSRSLALHWRDAAGKHVLSIRVAGRGVPPAAGRAVAPPGGGWTFNGSATMRGRTLILSHAVRAAGSAVYAVPEPASDLTLRFAARLGGDGGMTVALLQPRDGPLALGGSGGQFGFGPGLRGVAVTLGTARFGGDPSGNFVGVATSTGAGMRFARTTSAIPDLRRGTHRITVTVRGSVVRVYVDGRAVLSVRLPAIAIPARALIGFTGATGGAAGSQSVTGIVLTAGNGMLPAPGGGWSFNGSAAMSGSSASLTRAARNQAGSIVYPVALPTAGLAVTFTEQIYGGSGANGLTFALLDPARSTAASLGTDGGGEGFARLQGVAVALGTTMLASTANWADLWAGTAGTGGQDILQRARAIPPLRVGPHTVTVRVTGQAGSYIVSAWIDGELILRQAAPTLAGRSLLAFTGATGMRTDVHLVRDVAISAAS